MGLLQATGKFLVITPRVIARILRHPFRQVPFYLVAVYGLWLCKPGQNGSEPLQLYRSRFGDAQLGVRRGQRIFIVGEQLFVEFFAGS